MSSASRGSATRAVQLVLGSPSTDTVMSRAAHPQPASSTLSYQYGRAIVWLDDLTASREPHDYDLCERHTDRLSVPNGWRLEDRRSRRVLVFAASRRLAG